MTINRLTEFFDDDEITDFTPESTPSDVTVPREFFNEVMGLITELRNLYAENAQLHEAVRSLDLDVRAAEIDLQAARFQLARAFAEKLKKLRERASQ